MSEIARVLKPGGRLVLFTSTPEQMHQYWLGHYFPQMMTRAAAQMPSLDALNTAAQASGLTLRATEPFGVTKKLQDFFLYSGKYQPEIYLSPCVRLGISAFCNLCAIDELDKGLEKLQLDIETGDIDRIIRHTNGNVGDYCHVIFG